eukprot:5799701-Lingulodinium_polyedra.AAC.1
MAMVAALHRATGDGRHPANDTGNGRRPLARKGRHLPRPWLLPILCCALSSALRTMYLFTTFVRPTQGFNK